MQILYQAYAYNPAKITDRYLHIDLQTGLPVVNETVKTAKTNYTYRSYVLPEKDYVRYSKTIAAAHEIKRRFPYEVKLTEDI